MKTRLLWGVLVFASLMTNISAGPRDAQWKLVDEAANQGLPKTAIERLEPIIAGAMADKSYAEAITAISRKIALEGNIQGNKPEEKILRMQAELEKAPAEMKPAMEAILAHWYWQYFKQNRWRFMQRTQTAEAPGPDIQTWDLARILAEIDKHFSTALADEKTLKATPVSEYDDLLQKGSVPDTYRPTMFDFLAYEALQFYQAGEQAAVKAEDEFELDAASPVFADSAEFASWRPPTSDAASPTLKAIRLFQNLLKFHQADADRSAFYDADLARLTFGHNVAVGENKDDGYKAALRRFIEATTGHEISARALAALATQVNADGEPAEAHELARRGLDAFPGSAGGAMCFNLIQQIEAKSAQLDTERVWNAPWPTLNVTYRNVTKVYFRAVPVNFDDYVARTRWNFGYVDTDQRKRLLAATPALEWNADLPPTKDYKEHTEKLPAPTTLKPGIYFIVASHDPAFGEKENQVSLASVWVSDLALVLQSRNDGEPHSGFVLKANSGEPVAGATMRIWQQNREGWFKPIAPAKTDGNGRFKIQIKENTKIILLAEYDGQAVSSNRTFFAQGNSDLERFGAQTVFFTDRALYRPGQTISYKGVSICYDHKAGNYFAVDDDRITVVFKDPNGKEIARADHRTNDYGSFSGVFTAPRDRVMGRMSIEVLDGTGPHRLQRRGVQAPEVPGGAQRARRGRQARRSSQPHRKGHRLHRRRDRRSEGEMARRTRRAAAVLVLVVAAARHQGNRARHRRHRAGRHIQDSVRGGTGPRRAGEKRTGVRLHHPRRCDRHDRRDALRRPHRAGRVHRVASIAGRRTSGRRRTNRLSSPSGRCRSTEIPSRRTAP